MNVADPSLAASHPAGRTPLAVSLSPQFVNRLCSRLERGGPDIAGLLFGVAGEGLVLVQAFKSFTGESSDAVPPSGEALKHAFEQLLQLAHADPEVSVLDLIGWYWTRASGGLSAADVEFHNTHFPRPNSLALILKPEGGHKVVLELYTRANASKLSPQDHLWGALRLSTDLTVSGPIEVAMRSNAHDDAYLRTYQNMEALGRALGREDLPRKLRATVRLPFSMLRRKRDGAAPDFTHPPEVSTDRHEARIVRPPSPAPEERRAAANIVGPLRINAGEPPGLPALRAQAKRPVPWLWVWSAALCALMAGATFSFLLFHALPSGAALPPFLRAIFPDTGLDLRAEGQGDRVLLSWNRRNSVVRGASDGILHIDDGAQRRDVHLDAAQVENGLVLYRPGSNDVTFRLEIHGQQGARVAESVRVLDGSLDGSPHLTENTTVDTPPATNTPPKPAERRDWKIAATAKTDVPVAQPQPASNPTEQPASTITQQSGRLTATADPSSPPPPILVNPSASNPPAPSNQLGSTLGGAAAAVLDGSTSHASAPAAQAPAGDATQAPASEQTDSGAANPAIAKPLSPTRNAANTTAPTTPPVRLPLGTPQNRPPDSFAPPRATHQVLPDTSRLSPSLLVSSPEVEVLVLVDETGHVTAAHVVSHGKRVSGALAASVLAAARQWTFEPATFQGHTVTSHHTIVFQFRAPDR
ncbi:MAG: energy transducer TonB [Acidobacteriaceae bacterium]|nr:energy transducer TonB [Acidobacteriaceae bacterium]